MRTILARPIALLAIGLLLVVATPQFVRADDWNDHDRFLGQISMSYVRDGFHDRVDAFSGSAHLNMVDVVLPGKGGLDLVIQHYYSSAIWNRVEGTVYTKHAASSDPMDHLGGGGWQLHMGKLISSYLPTDPWIAVMPDGSTHPLYNSYLGQGRISRDRWTLFWNSSTSAYDLTLTDGTVYSFGNAYTYSDYHRRTVYQCTKISTPGVSSSIQIQYGGSPPLMTTVTDTYGRTVTFQYLGDPKRIQTMAVSTGQTWTFAYSSTPQDNFLQENGLTRPVYSLNSIQPPAGNPWSFTYYPSSTPYGNGKYCLQRATLPTGGSITYTYSQVGFDTGTQLCTVQFSVVASRQVKDRDDSTVLGTWWYAYSTPGADGATTTVTVKDAQNTTLQTETNVFHGWGPYTYWDEDMWKVGLLQQRTVTTPSLQATVETHTWTQGDILSLDDDHTTSWLDCANPRNWSAIYFARPGNVTATTTRDGLTYTTETTSFDAYGNPLALTERVGSTQKRTTSLTYWTNTSRNILVGKVATKSASPGASECFAYDTYGHRTKKVLTPYSTSPCTGNAASLETDYSHDASTGDLIAETRINPGGLNSETDFLSYANGQPGQIKVYGTNVFFDRVINPAGTIASSTDGRGDSSAYRTTYTYDALNRLTKVQPPVSGSLPTTFAYAANWSTVTVARGNHSIVYSFDGLGRLTQKHDQQTTHKTTFTYNALGTKIGEQRLFGSTPVDTHAFDLLGRPTSVTHNGDGSTVTYTYGGATGVGPVTTVVDEEYEDTVLAYEAFGSPEDARLVKVTDADGQATTYQYNGYNLLSAIQAPLAKGNRGFTYYGNLLLNTETHQESGTTSYTYDGLGNLTRKTSHNGDIEDFTYDRAGRVLQHSFVGTINAFTWDGASQRTQMSNANGTFYFAYDGNKNLTSKQSCRSGLPCVTETFAYDTRDRLQTATYPSGRKVTYVYDDRDWVTAVQSSSGGSHYATNITRHVTGAIDQITLGNGKVTSYGLDSRHRIDSISLPGVLNLSLDYDDVNNLTVWDDLLDSANDRTFGYDHLHRLSSASGASLFGSISYEYDVLGNRTKRTQTRSGASQVTNYTINTANRLTQAVTNSLPEETYSYDLRGNVTQATVPRPGITSLSPAAAQVRPSGGTTQVLVTINGAGFLPSSAATFNGAPKPTTYLTSTQVRATLTYNDLTSANIFPIAVTNPAAPEGEVPAPPNATAPFVVHFADVPPSHPQYGSINLIRYNGITAGCDASGNYCPASTLTRAQMAVFLLKAKHGSSYAPPACNPSSPIFADVACPSGFAVDWIEQFYREGITAGCGTNPLRYCPDATITKAEMAVFLLKSKDGSSYTPPACTGVFADVPCPSGFAVNWIEEIAERGVDTGCGGGNFCPTQTVSRALMAQMVARTWAYQTPFTSPSAGTDTYTFTLNDGNQLASVQGPAGIVSFDYDPDGRRFAKVAPSATTLYLRDPSGEVIAEYTG
ncbi:MAG: S-layer homology domain-containing protein, partial [Acidobacteriota bacterium]